MELFAFSLYISTIICLELLLHRRIFTPLTCLALPYLAMITINNLFIVEYLDFFLVDSESLFMTAYFITLIFLVSYVMKTIFQDGKQKVIKSTHHNMTNCINTFYICVTMLICRYISIYQAISIHGYGDLRGKIGGIFAYLSWLLVPLLPTVIFNDKISKWKRGVLLSATFISFAIAGGKYPFVISLLYLYLYYCQSQNMTLSKLVSHIVILVVLAIFVFFATYLGIFLISSYDTVNLNYDYMAFVLYVAMNNFAVYLFGPLIAQNYFYSAYLGDVSLFFIVPINIITSFGSRDFLVYQAEYTPISSEFAGNVGGIFAEATYIGGVLAATVYIVTIITIIYYIYMISLSNRRFILSRLFLMAILLISFFGNFFMTPGVLMPLILLIMVESSINFVRDNDE